MKSKLKLTLSIITMFMGIFLVGIKDTHATTNGSTRFYLHSMDVSEENSTYNSMLPHVLPEGNNNSAAGADSAAAFATPCETGSFDQDTEALIDTDATTGDKCVATFYGAIVGTNIVFSSTDTNSITTSVTYDNDSTAGLSSVLRARIYEYVESGSTFTLIDQTDSATLTNNVTNTTISWNGTPCNQATECGNTASNTLDAGNRLVLILSLNISSLDSSGGADSVDVHFDKISQPSYLNLSYTLTTQDKPSSFGGSNDDDFTTNATCASSCDGSSVSATRTWNIETSGNSTTEHVEVNNSAGSSQWMTITDVKTADGLGTSLANYTYAYQAAPSSGDGDVMAQVSVANSLRSTTDPRDLGGLLLRFSSDSDFLLIQVFHNGTNYVAQVNDNGVLGTSATITGFANNVILAWSKSGNSYQPKYCNSAASDCTSIGNFTNIGSAITGTGTWDRMGLASYVEFVTTNSTQQTSAFEWFKSTVGLTLGGTVCTNEACSGNVGANKTVNLLVNGSGSYTDETDASGIWSIASVIASSGDVITVYIDNETEEGTTILISDGTAKSDIHIYQNVTAVRMDTGSSITPDNMFTGDGGDDDIKYSVSASSNGNLTIDSGFEFHIWTGDTFDSSGGTVTTQGTGNIHKASSAIVTLDTTGNTIDGDVLIDGPGSFRINGSTAINGGDITLSGSTPTLTTTAGTPTVTMSGTGSIGGGTSPIIIFHNLTTTGTGTTTIADATTLNGDISVGSGTTLQNNAAVVATGDIAVTGKLIIAATLTVNGGALTTSGTGVGGVSISYSNTPTTTIDGAGNLGGGTGTITFYNLTLGDGSGSTTTTLATNNSIIDNKLTVSASQTFAMATNSLTIGSTSISDSGDITIASGGVTTQSSGTVTILGNSGDAADWSGPGEFDVANLTIGNDSTTFTVDNITNDLPLDIAGSFTLNNAATFQASSSGTKFQVGANWVVDSTSAVFTPGDGTVTLDASIGAPSITSGGDAFYNLSIDNSSANFITWELQDALDVNNDLLIDSDNTLDAKSGGNFSVNVAGNFTQNGTYTARTNTTTLDGAGGTTQAITGDITYSTLSITSSTTRVIQVESGSFQTISTGITLAGTSCSAMLIFRASTLADPYTIVNSDASPTVSYIDFQDATVTTNSFSSGTGITDSGGNGGITFDNTCEGGSNSADASNYSFQRKTFKDSTNTVHWLFFHDGDQIEYKYSSDNGSTWVRGGSLAYDTNDFSVWQAAISGTEYVWLAVDTGDDILVRRGTLASTSITWDSEANVVALNGTGASDTYAHAYISLDSSNYMWVLGRYYDGSNYKIHAVRSDVSDTGEVTWSGVGFGTTVTAKTLSDDQTSSNTYGNIVPLASQDMYATFVSGTALEGCMWDSSDSQFEDSTGAVCSPTAGGGESEGSSTRGTGGVKIDDAGNPGSLSRTGRQLVQTSGGKLYSFINDDGSCEMWYSSNGASWEEKDTADNPSCSITYTDITIEIDNDDIIHISYTDDGDDTILKYISYDTAADNFGSEATIYDSSNVVNATLLAVDSTNKQHVIFVDTNESNSWIVKYTNNISGSWKSPVNIESVSTELSKIGLVINEDNVPEVVYTNINDADLTAAVGNQRDATSFTLHDVDTSVSIGTSENSIGVDKDGNTWVSYIDVTTNFVTLVKHNDADAWISWQTPVTNSNVGTNTSMSLIGNTMFIFYSEDSTDTKIVYDAYDGGTADWLGETVVSTPGGGNDFSLAKSRYSKYNFHEPWLMDVLYYDTLDIYWSYVDLRSAHINNSSNFGSLLGSGRQLIKKDSGELYMVVNNSSSAVIEVWKSSDGYIWEEQGTNIACSNNGCFGVVGAIRSTGVIDIIFADLFDSGIAVDYDLEHVTFSTVTDTFGSQTNISNPAAETAIQNLSITIDASDKAHIIWTEANTINYSNNVGGTFKSPVAIETPAAFPGSSDLTIDIDGKPQVAYVNSADDDLTVRRGNVNDATQFTTDVHDVDTDINDTSTRRGVSIGVDTLTGNTWVGYIDDTSADDVSTNDAVTLAKHAYSDGWTTWSTVTTKTDVGFEPSLAITGSSDIYVFYQEDSTDQKIAYDVYDSDALSPAWDGETVLQTTSGTDLGDVKTKWSFEWNNFGSNRIEYLFSDGTDVYWDYLFVRRSPTDIDNASNFGVQESTRPVIRTSSGDLYAIFNKSTLSLEVWKSSDNGNTWSEQDSGDSPTLTGTAVYVTAAIDSSDIIHIGYSNDDGVSDCDIKYITFTTSTGQFGSVENIDTSGNGGTCVMALTIDSGNFPHVIYLDASQISYSNRITGGVWKSPVSVEGITTAIGLDISISDEDIPEVSYLNSTDSDLTAAVGDQNNATSFGTPFDIDTSVKLVTFLEKTSIGIDTSGNTWVSYVDEDGTDDYVTLAKHADADAWTTWTTDITNSKVGNELSIAVNGGDIYVFYEDDQDDIVFDKYNGSTWSGETLLEEHGSLRNVKVRWSLLNNASYTTYGFDYLYTDGTDVFYNKFAIDSVPGAQDAIDTVPTGLTKTLSAVADSTNYDVHLVYIDDESTDQVSYRRWDNGTLTWQTVVNLDASANDAYPSLAINTTNRNLYAFYIDTSANIIYYEKCTMDASECEAADWAETSWKSGSTFSAINAGYGEANEAFAEWSVGSTHVTIDWDRITEAAVTSFTLSNYRWYVDSDALDVTDAWSAAASIDLAENTELPTLPVAYDPLSSSQEIRLRVGFTVNNSNLTASAKQFKLQYKEGTDSSCTSGDWTDLGGANAWTYATSSVSDGATIITPRLAASDVGGHYAKSAPTTANANTATTTQDIEYDFHIIAGSAYSGATRYLFRVVESAGTAFDTYTNCPALSTEPGTESLMRHGEFYTNYGEQGFWWAD